MIQVVILRLMQGKSFFALWLWYQPPSGWLLGAVCCFKNKLPVIFLDSVTPDKSVHLSTIRFLLHWFGFPPFKMLFVLTKHQIWFRTSLNQEWSYSDFLAPKVCEFVPMLCAGEHTLLLLFAAIRPIGGAVAALSNYKARNLSVCLCLPHPFMYLDNRSSEQLHTWPLFTASCTPLWHVKKAKH